MKLCQICKQMTRPDRAVPHPQSGKSVCGQCYNIMSGKQLKGGASAPYGTSVLVGKKEEGMKEEWSEGRKLRVDSDVVGENGVFKEKNVKEMPLYLQRLFMKKKVLYTRHQVSIPSSCLIEAERQESEPVSMGREKPSEPQKPEESMLEERPVMVQHKEESQVVQSRVEEQFQEVSHINLENEEANSRGMIEEQNEEGGRRIESDQSDRAEVEGEQAQVLVEEQSGPRDE